MSDRELNLPANDQAIVDMLASIPLHAGPPNRDALIFACGRAAAEANRPTHRNARPTFPGQRIAIVLAAFFCGGIVGAQLDRLRDTSPLPNSNSQLTNIAPPGSEGINPAGPPLSKPSQTWPADGKTIYAGLTSSQLATFLSNESHSGAIRVADESHPTSDGPKLRAAGSIHLLLGPSG